MSKQNDREKPKRLADINPELAKEWHPTKNGKLKATDVTAFSSRKVWWIMPYDDPITGKHFDFEWISTVSNRSCGMGCPYLSGKAVWRGYNDLVTTNPELAKEWHPTRNGWLKATDVTASSEKKVWWLMPYNDPKTGKHFDFEWMASIISRTRGTGNPFITGKKVWKGFNDLETTYPILAEEWDYKRNRGLSPWNVTAFSGKIVWWKCQNNHRWRASVASRSRSTGCPICNNIVIQKEERSMIEEHNKNTRITEHRKVNIQTEAYDLETFSKLFWLIFNEENIKENNLVEKALHNHIAAELWLFISLFYIINWTASDIIDKFSYIYLSDDNNPFGLKIDTLRSDIINDNIDYIPIVEFITLKTKHNTIKPAKVHKPIETQLSFTIPNGLKKHIGRLVLIAEYHHYTGNDGYMQYNRIQRYVNWVTLSSFFGDKYIEIMGKNNLQLRRLKESSVDAHKIADLQTIIGDIKKHIPQK